MFTVADVFHCGDASVDKDFGIGGDLALDGHRGAGFVHEIHSHEPMTGRLFPL